MIALNKHLFYLEISWKSGHSDTIAKMYGMHAWFQFSFMCMLVMYAYLDLILPLHKQENLGQKKKKKHHLLSNFLFQFRRGKWHSLATRAEHVCCCWTFLIVGFSPRTSCVAGVSCYDVLLPGWRNEQSKRGQDFIRWDCGWVFFKKCLLKIPQCF